MPKIKSRRQRKVRISKEGANKWRNIITNSDFWVNRTQTEMERLTGIPDATLSLIKKGLYDRGAEDWECLRYYCKPINPATNSPYTAAEMIDILFEYPSENRKSLNLKQVRKLSTAIARQIELDGQDEAIWIEIRCQRLGISENRMHELMYNDAKATDVEIGKLSCIIVNNNGDRFDDKFIASIN